MRIKIEEFEALAKRQGFKNGNALMRELGGRKLTYHQFQRGNRIGYELVRQIYNTFGAETMVEVVNLENETLRGFESKFIIINGVLY